VEKALAPLGPPGQGRSHDPMNNILPLSRVDLIICDKRKPTWIELRLDGDGRSSDFWLSRSACAE